MDLEFGEKYERLRSEVLGWARANWPLQGEEAELPLARQERLFRQRGMEAGYIARTVPKQYGGGGLAPDVLAETVIRQALREAETPWVSPNAQGTQMLVPTLLDVGSEEQRRQYIPPTLLGDIKWCQGYSEPGSGSDLASLQAKAELVGDEWVLNGQKIWTSNAREADMMFGLFRSEPGEARHAGISYLLIDMKTPGITAKVLKQMNGGEDFCEVFFDDVRIPAGNIVGKRGEGWRVSKATLKHERMLIGDASTLQVMFDDLIELARNTERDGRPAIEDPKVRAGISEIEGFVETQRFASTRMVSAIARSEDMKAMNEMMMTKLYLTNASQRIVKLVLDLLGDEGLRAPTRREGAGMGFKTPGAWLGMYMATLGIAVAGGASNIQRNIIGERLLGLPRDLRRDEGALS